MFPHYTSLPFQDVVPKAQTMDPSTDPYRLLRKKVAVVGSGSPGIGALWALNKTYHDVYVYEASDRLGGHTNTVDFKKGKFSTKVDTGFHVLNAETFREFTLLYSLNGQRATPMRHTSQAHQSSVV